MLAFCTKPRKRELAELEIAWVRSKVQKKRREAEAPRPLSENGLERLNVGSLQTLRSAHNLEFNGLSLVEGAVPVALDGGEMDENVLAALALDETKSFAGVKPLHCTLFFHRCFSFSNNKAI